MPHLIKLVKFLSKSSLTSTVSFKTHMYLEKNHVDTCGSIIEKCNKGLTYRHITQLHLSTMQGQIYVWIADYLNIPQCRNPDVHKKELEKKTEWVYAYFQKYQE